MSSQYVIQGDIADSRLALQAMALAIVKVVSPSG